jgi:hypothetical protein
MSLSKEPTAKTQGDVSLVLGFLVFGPLVLGSLVLGSLPASAQHRPLTVQDPEVIGQGQVLVEAGAESGTHVKYPVSGLTGDRWALPVGVSIGLGPSVELQLDGGYQWLSIDRRDLAPLDDRVGSGDRTSDVIDVVVATKIRLFTEGSRRPALGLRLATELPNASNESGLGLDTLNFSASLLLGRTVGSTRIAANAGVVLLSDVLQGSLQQDAFVGGVSLTRALTPGLDAEGAVCRRAADRRRAAGAAARRAALHPRRVARRRRADCRRDPARSRHRVDRRHDLGHRPSLARRARG